MGRLGRTISFHLTYVSLKSITKDTCYRIIGMQAILVNYRLTSDSASGIGLRLGHSHWPSSSSFISAGQLFQPHRRTSGGFRVGGGVNAAGVMLTFCWDILLG